MPGKLFIYRGLSGSGKSTDANTYVAANPENVIRVNRDSLRITLHNGKYIHGITEKYVIDARNALIALYLKKGMTVLNDDTNLRHSVVKDLIKLAVKVGAEWEILDFTDVSVEDCVWRDATRDGSVGQNVIIEQYNKFLKNPQKLDLSQFTAEPFKPEVYVPNTSLPRAYIVDLDGTTALFQGKRSPYDYTNVLDDEPNLPVIDVVTKLAENSTILFTSGRPDSCRDQTIQFIEKYILTPEWWDTKSDYKLFMRTTGDSRTDYIVKYELFDNHIRNNYNVLGSFDDRNQVVYMWRQLGLTCFQVARGDF